MAAEPHPEPARVLPSVAGTCAILLWSTGICLTRSLTERLGVVSAPAYFTLAAAAVALTVMLVQPRRRERLRLLSPTYLALCGGFFVANLVLTDVAIGFCRTRSQVVLVGLINYLWPSLTLLLSIPILGHRARVWLVPGMLMAFAGVAAAGVQGAGFTHEQFLAGLGDNWGPYVAILVAAVSWGLYNNFSRRLGGAVGSAGVPLFLLVAGVILLAIAVPRHEVHQWSRRTVIEFVLMSVFARVLPYFCWDWGMRCGHMVYLVSCSYLIPLFSTVITCLYLGLAFTPLLALACVLVIGGAVVCRLSLRETPAGRHA